MQLAEQARHVARMHPVARERLAAQEMEVELQRAAWRPPVGLPARSVHLAQLVWALRWQ